MKKWIVVISLVSLLALAAGCGSTEAEPSGGLNDGTYSAASAATDKGYVLAEVDIEGGAIAAVTLVEYNDKGVPKGDDYRYDAWFDAMAQLPGMFVEANSADIDTVTGATSTTDKARDAVGRALRKADGFGGSFDGMHMGVADVDGRGSYGIAFVTVVNGEITAVELKEVDGEGQFKEEDYSYEPFHEAAAEMAQRFADSNSPQVDTFTGATSSSDKWIQAVERALDNAR